MGSGIEFQIAVSDTNVFVTGVYKRSRSVAWRRSVLQNFQQKW